MWAERFGLIAIGQGFTTLERVEECLADQRARLERGERVEIGEILVERGYLTRAQFLEVLGIQKSIPWLCRPCESLWKADEVARPGVCPRCERPLDVPARRET